MNGLEKVKRARDILEITLGTSIITSELNVRFKRFHAMLRDGTQIYVQYNEHDEYSYSILFSLQEIDRVRFDNYDDLWDVPSRPHHVHLRYKENGEESKMNGDPEDDMNTLTNFLKV